MRKLMGIVCLLGVMALPQVSPAIVLGPTLSLAKNVCYTGKERYTARPGYVYTTNSGCSLSAPSCASVGKLSFGSYSNTTAARAGLQKCTNAVSEVAQ